MFEYDHLSPRDAALMLSQRAADLGLSPLRICYYCSTPFMPQSSIGLYCSLRCKDNAVKRRRRDRERQNPDGTGGHRPDLSFTTEKGPAGIGAYGYFEPQLPKSAANADLEHRVEIERAKLGLTALEGVQREKTESEKTLEALGFTPGSGGARAARSGGPVAPDGGGIEPERMPPGPTEIDRPLPLAPSGDPDAPETNAHGRAKNPT
jgi:hypothetical protein